MKTLSKKLLPLLVAGLSLAVHAEEVKTDAVPAAEAAAQPSGDTGLTGEILFQFLVAEMAVSRGQLPLASAQYWDLAKRTRDARIARRAAEVALYGQQWQAALEATRLWSELEPESAQARHTLWIMLANAGRSEELTAQLKEGLRNAGDGRRELLLQLPRVFAGGRDKVGAAKVIFDATSEWTGLPEARLVRAQASVAAADDAAALKEINEALVLKPDWQGAVLFKAQLLGRQSTEAVDLLTAFIGRYPDARDVRLTLARLLVDAKRYQEARVQYAKLLETQADNPELLYAVGLLSLQLEDVKAAEAPLKRLLEIDFKDKDAIHYYLGQIAETRGATDEAVAHYDAVGADANRVALSRLRAAELLRRAGRVDESLQRLRAAGPAAPVDKETLLLAESQMLVSAGRLEEAYQLLDKALAADPDNAALLYESAMLGERTHRAKESETRLRRFVVLKPEDPQGWNALGYTLADRGEHLDEAQQYIDKALALAPNDFYVLDSKGWLAFRLGDLKGAETWLRRAYAARPDVEIAAHLGEVLWVQGRKDEARAVWAEASKADSTNEALRETIKRFLP